MAGGKIEVRVIPTEQFTEEAARAEQRFKITPREVATQSPRRRRTSSSIFLGVAVQCGLNRVVMPFFDRGIPVEYELIRSICTVAEQKRKKVGILATDAQLYGRFNMQSMSPGRNWPIIDELEKQYEVVQVDATQPIDLKAYDVLLAVQPSSLGPEQMDNFVRAVRAGLPTAIFEDPAPLLAGDVPGTGDPRRPPGGMNPMMMMQQQPPPKGDIGKLWSLLGVDFSGRDDRLAGLQSLSQGQPVPQGIRLHRRRQRRRGAVQSRRADQFRAATGALPVPRLDHQAEHVGAGDDAAGGDGHEDRHGQLRRHVSR